MAQVVELTRITHSEPDGEVSVFWSDGNSNVYMNAAAIQELAPENSPEKAKELVMCRVIALDPTLTDLSAHVGTYTVDSGALQMVAKS